MWTSPSTPAAFLHIQMFPSPLTHVLNCTFPSSPTDLHREEQGRPNQLDFSSAPGAQLWISHTFWKQLVSVIQGRLSWTWPICRRTLTAALDSVSTSFVEHENPSKGTCDFFDLRLSLLEAWGAARESHLHLEYPQMFFAGSFHSASLLSFPVFVCVFCFLYFCFLSTWESSPPGMGVSKLQPYIFVDPKT